MKRRGWKRIAAGLVAAFGFPGLLELTGCDVPPSPGGAPSRGITSTSSESYCGGSLFHEGSGTTLFFPADGGAPLYFDMKHKSTCEELDARLTQRATELTARPAEETPQPDAATAAGDTDSPPPPSPEELAIHRRLRVTTDRPTDDQVVTSYKSQTLHSALRDISKGLLGERMVPDEVVTAGPRQKFEDTWVVYVLVRHKGDDVVAPVKLHFTNEDGYWNCFELGR
jgi:hypothetical protein